MFYQSSKDGRSAHFVLKNYSLTTPPFHVLLSTKRPIHAFKFDGPQNRYRGWDDCAARNHLGTSERNRRRFLSIKILYRVFHQSLQKKTNSLEKILILHGSWGLQRSFMPKRKFLPITASRAAPLGEKARSQEASEIEEALAG
ncbi:hypothetical protein H4Q26_007892 [Puccinia striiformis f. sp. tritici PST-130]|uniref:Uncharacterized protein n=1 Tax=Puccinia striiformis f. sp. tritici PST-78 TaxID=1165861 RepID=A0A0L0VBK8_9BASI|nr:hypothetical protein H4Q26_007892 [Puccinia striiformis f. sp. tritici PST-130]KNE96653.1 hypothetical protein PSTG_10058 [Puccinia striiformis f. sp. tritici PST-78]